MAEPTITCPKCGTETRLTQSLAAPMLAVIRKQYDDRLSAKDTDIAMGEASLRDQQAAVENAQAGVNEQVAATLRTERTAIAAEEAKKARVALESDHSGKDRLIADLNETIKAVNAKLTTAQKVEAELVRRQRDLDHAKRGNGPHHREVGDRVSRGGREQGPSSVRTKTIAS